MSAACDGLSDTWNIAITVMMLLALVGGLAWAWWDNR